MSGQRWSPQELADKIDYEGGLYDAVTCGGLIADDLDDSDPALKKAWVAFVHGLEMLEPVDSELRSLLPEPS